MNPFTLILVSNIVSLGLAISLAVVRPSSGNRLIGLVGVAACVFALNQSLRNRFTIYAMFFTILWALMLMHRIGAIRQGKRNSAGK